MTRHPHDATLKEIYTVTARRIAVAATGLALAAVLSACGGSHSGMTGMSSSTATAGGSSASGASSAASDTARQGDIAFAQSMIPHHQQAIEMADLALKNASSAKVKELATQIKGAQDPEIKTMKGWLSSWGAPEDMGMDHSGMGGMTGMMSDADMKKLEAARGADFDTMWLQMMIAHHQGALTMANDVLTTTQDPDVKTLAQAVVSGQTKEIDTMKGLLAG